MTIEKLPPDQVLTVQLFGSDVERIVNLLLALLALPHSLTRPAEIKIQRTLEAFRAAVMAAKKENPGA